MTELRFELPDGAAEFISEVVASGEYSSASEFVLELVEQAQMRRGQEVLRDLVDEGEESGDGTEITTDWWQKRLAELRAQGSAQESQS